MHHDLMASRLYIPLMVNHLGVLDPKVQAVKAAVGDHLVA